jgi:thiamine-monophosphate kinase
MHVHAMMDLSDGLSLDLARLARASGCGALLTDVPLGASTEAVAEAAGASARAWALDGGEDYELLIAVERRAFGHLARRFAKHFGASLFAVGCCTEGNEVLEEVDGVVRGLAVRGWDHIAGLPHSDFETIEK